MSNGTKRTLIISLILLLVSGAAFGFMLVWVISQGNVLTEQVETLQASISQQDTYSQLQRLADTTKTDRESIRSYFLQRESESIDFLNLVEATAPQAGVTLSTESLGQVSGSGGEVWIEPAFAFSGTRDQVDNFIKVLETLPYVLRVTSVDMSAMSSNTWRAEVTMQVRVMSYDQ